MRSAPIVARFTRFAGFKWSARPLRSTVSHRPVDLLDPFLPTQAGSSFMLAPIRNFWADLARTARLADLFDIALVAAFLFVIITWLQQSTSRQTSRSLLVVVSVLGLIYAAARVFEMYLVETLIEVVLIVLVFMTIVAFQSDVRRLIDRIGTAALFTGSTGRNASSSTANLLTEAVAKMADEQTGALIAIKGRDTWDRLLQGGIPLDGAVSQPLLHSLFNTRAPGHDGAVLLEGDRIVQFATHLPLSSNLPALSRSGGTRHAAALGLSEQCDAFVIVVSEERGTISVAHQGQLSTVASASELKDQLDAFWMKHYDGDYDRPAWWRRRMPRTALLAVGLAVLLWLAFAYQPDTVYRVYTVPIELRNLEPHWRLAEPTPPSEAQATLAGSDPAFDALDPSALVISLDLTDIEEGLNEFVINEDNLAMPSGLDLYQVNPTTITVRVQGVRPVTVPVEVQATGSLPDSLTLVALAPDPDSVTIFAPDNGDTLPTAIPTEPIELERITESATIETALALPPPHQLSADQSSTVSVRVRVQRKALP